MRVRITVCCFIILATCSSLMAQGSHASSDSSVRQQSRQMMADYIQHLQQELAADPDNISLQMDLGRAYYGIAVDRRGASYADAQRIFEKILQRDPSNPRALAYHGALLGLEIG